MKIFIPDGRSATHPYTKWQKSRPIPIPELKHCDPSERHLRTKHFLGLTSHTNWLFNCPESNAASLVLDYECSELGLLSFKQVSKYLFANKVKELQMKEKINPQITSRSQ